MALLKTILIILLIYYGLKFLFRLLSPYIFRYLSKKVSQRFENMFQSYQNQGTQPEKEGTVHIDHAPKRNRTSNSNVGEYIEYEEID